MILFNSNSNGFGAIKLKPASASASENSEVEVTDFTSYANIYALIDFTWTLRYSCSAKRNAINYRGVSTGCYQDLLTPSMGYKLYSLLIASYRRKPKELV